MTQVDSPHNEKCFHLSSTLDITVYTVLSMALCVANLH